jgi:hypothetical protein
MRPDARYLGKMVKKVKMQNVPTSSSGATRPPAMSPDPSLLALTDDSPR